MRTPLLVPRWFAALLLSGTGAVVASGLVGLLLAIVGWFHTSVTVVAGVAGAGAGAALAIRAAPEPGTRRRRRATAGGVAAVLVALTFVAAGWDTVGGAVVLDRDPGLYASTARWLAREGSLAVDARVGPFATAEHLSFVSVGMYDLDDTTLEFQSNHLTPALHATAYGVAGVGGLRHLSLVLVAGGLLAVYALATRLTGRIWTSLAAITVLAWSLPTLSVARDPLSEPVVLLLLWTGLWLWTVAVDVDRRLPALAAGVCLGACLAARIDAAAYLVPVPLAVGVLARRRGWRLAWPLAVGLLPGAAAALADVGLRSRGYLGDLETEIASLYALLVLTTNAALLVALLGDRWPRPGRFVIRHRRRLGRAIGAAIVVGLALLWFIRPHVQHARADDSELIEAIQRQQGDEVDGRRRYHELSMRWQAWYLGPVVVGGGVVGAGLLARRLLRGRPVDAPLLVPVVALGAGTILYLVRPAIAPDQVWAMRRFIPAALPLWCVLAGVAAGGGVSVLRLAGWRPPARAGIAVAAVGVALAPVVARTWPVRDFRDQDGYLAIVESACDTVGDDGVIVLPEGSKAGSTLTQTLRSWCDVPVALLEPSATAATVGALASAWADEGRELWVVADVFDELARYVASPEMVVLGPVSSDRFLEDTLTSPPNEYQELEVNLVATRAGGG